MAGGSIGGFFVKLGLQTDQASFNSGMNALKGFESAAHKAAAALGVTTGGIFAMAKAAGTLENAQLKQARAIGISAGALSNWKLAASMAGASGAALASSMQQIENKMQRIKLGQVDTTLAKNLGFLGLGLNDFSKMDANQRMRAVFTQADKMKDQQKAALLISEILGSGAREYYDYLKLAGTSIDQELKQAAALNYTTEQSRKSAQIFNHEINAASQGAKSLVVYFGSRMAEALTPAVRRIKNILITQKDEIRRGINGLADSFGNAVNGIIGFIGKIGPVAVSVVNRLGGLDKIILKIGLGISALKIAQVAGGIAKTVAALGGLKSAIIGLGSAGLIGGGLFLLLDDLLVYFSDNGGRSVTGYIIDNLDELKQKFNFNIDASGFERLGNAIGKLMENLTGADSIKGSFLKISEGILSMQLSSISTTINLLSDLADVMAHLMGGEWDKLGESIKKFFRDYADGLKNFLHLTGAGDENAGKTEITTDTGAVHDNEAFNRIVEAVKARKGGKTASGSADFKALTEDEKASLAEYLKKHPARGPLAIKLAFENVDLKSLQSMQDGIMRPDGTITRVAPDDWVFAARNVEDLAAAFLPPGMTNNSVNAPASFVINQSFTINGSSSTAAAIKVQAYNGATEALRQTMTNSQRIMQLMPGQR